MAWTERPAVPDPAALEQFLDGWHRYAEGDPAAVIKATYIGSTLINVNVSWGRVATLRQEPVRASAKPEASMLLRVFDRTHVALAAHNRGWGRLPFQPSRTLGDGPDVLVYSGDVSKIDIHRLHGQSGDDLALPMRWSVTPGTEGGQSLGYQEEQFLLPAGEQNHFDPSIPGMVLAGLADVMANRLGQRVTTDEILQQFAPPSSVPTAAAA